MRAGVFHGIVDRLFDREQEIAANRKIAGHVGQVAGHLEPAANRRRLQEAADIFAGVRHKIAERVTAGVDGPDEFVHRTGEGSGPVTERLQSVPRGGTLGQLCPRYLTLEHELGEPRAHLVVDVAGDAGPLAVEEVSGFRFGDESGRQHEAREGGGSAYGRHQGLEPGPLPEHRLLGRLHEHLVEPQRRVDPGRGAKGRHGHGRLPGCRRVEPLFPGAFGGGYDQPRCVGEDHDRVAAVALHAEPGHHPRLMRLVERTDSDHMFSR